MCGPRRHLLQQCLESPCSREAVLLAGGCWSQQHLHRPCASRFDQCKISSNSIAFDAALLVPCRPRAVCSSVPSSVSGWRSVVGGVGLTRPVRCPFPSVALNPSNQPNWCFQPGLSSRFVVFFVNVITLSYPSIIREPFTRGLRDDYNSPEQR